MTERAFRHPRGQIVLMTRAPIEGTVKTRLAAATGAAAALRVHVELLTRTLTEATRARLAPVSLWVTGDRRNHLISNLARDYDLPVHAQCGAGLGERMATVFDRMLAHADFCVLIGTDCPPLDAGYLQQACAALAAGRDLVLGPAEDGGYVLIGLRAPQPALFDAIPWGTDAVSRRTLAIARMLELDCRVLPALWDLDRPEDLRRYSGSASSAPERG
jgi:uncharacterized protein